MYDELNKVGSDVSPNTANDIELLNVYSFLLCVTLLTNTIHGIDHIERAPSWVRLKMPPHQGFRLSIL